MQDSTRITRILNEILIENMYRNKYKIFNIYTRN